MNGDLLITSETDNAALDGRRGIEAPEPSGDRWIICQIGAREHYAVARALAAAGRLDRLVTDLWAPPRSAMARLSPGIKGRWRPELSAAKVESRGLNALAFEARVRMAGRRGWDRIMARNAWFGRWAAERIRRSAPMPDDRPQTVFAYSYAAGDIFAAAKEMGWVTILDQIDPGPVEARLVEGLYRAAGQEIEPIPQEYWSRWRRELDLADRIVVNSRWSKDALIEEGVAPSRIDVIPLAYEPAPVAACAQTERRYPERFTRERPLRALFLGQVTLRKGIGVLLDAIDRIDGFPIEVTIVGPVQFGVSDRHAAHPNLRWIGPAPRADVARHYAAADVFVFPTLSDGFGLTQLEALSAGLPVIASDRCGDVVQNNINGLRLPVPTPETIASALITLANDPRRLAAMSRAAPSRAREFTLERLRHNLRTSAEKAYRARDLDRRELTP